MGGVEGATASRQADHVRVRHADRGTAMHPGIGSTVGEKATSMGHTPEPAVEVSRDALVVLPSYTTTAGHTREQESRV